MSSVAPCLEFCSDDKSSQTALLMELSPLSNNTQPSPKDSGVDVSSPSRRDEDTFFGSPQVPQAVSLASKRSVSIKNFGNNCTVGMLETSNDMLNSSGLSTLNTSIASSPSICSLDIGSKKSDGKACSKTSKFYSRDRKKHFNIGEFQAKEFRKIIMSDSKDKKKKCSSVTKSSSLNGKTLNSHQAGFLGAALKKTSQDLNKNYAVAPIEEKKVGIVIRVNKPFSNLESKKRKISVDKLESKKFSTSPNISLDSLDQDRIEVDRSSNMSPTMPELHKETPFDEDKFPVEDRRSTRSKANHRASAESLQSERRSNLRSATRTTQTSLLEENAGAEKCPLPPVIIAIESSEESSAMNYLPKKITCKLAGNVIVKTLTSNNQVHAKSRPKSKKCKGVKSSPRETHEYLQVKSISGLKIKLSKPKTQRAEIISNEHEGSSKLSDFSAHSNGHLNLVCTSQTTKTSSSSLDSVIPCKLVSSFSVSSPIVSPVQFCSSVCQYPIPVSMGNTNLTGLMESTCTRLLTNRTGSSKGGFHLEEDEDGKVKLTQEKEVVMPDGKRKKLKLKMFVPSAIISPTRADDTKESNLIERLSHPSNQPADTTLTFCSSDSLSPRSKFYVSPPGRRTERGSCTFPSLNYDSFNVPAPSTEGNLDPQLAYPISNNFLPQCTSQNSFQFSGDAAEIQSNRTCDIATASGSLTLCRDASQSHVDYLGSSSQSKGHRLLKNHLCDPLNTSFSSKISTNPVLINHSKFSSLQEQKFSLMNHEEDSKCNSIITANPSVAPNTSRIDVPSEVIGIPGDGNLYSYCSNASSATTLSSCFQPTGSHKNLSSVLTTTYLKECCNSLESHSKGSGSIKLTGDEFEDYGEMPTLEKNEIFGQTYNFDQCDKSNLVKLVIAKSDVDNKTSLEDSQMKILEKENVEEKSIKKTFKFDGLELEYSMDDISKSGEGCITARRLRKRGKEEKEEPEKIDKPKRKRGASRTSAKKIKGFTLASALETSSPQDEQLGHLSHIGTHASLMSPTTHLSNMDNKSENSVFSKAMLSQSFDFSTPPPSDASCPLGEFAFSSLDDLKSSSLGSSTVSSKFFCVDQPMCSGSVTHSSSSTACSSNLVVSSTSTILSSSAAFRCPPLPWSQTSIASPKSHATSENLNSMLLSSVRQTRSLDLPVISSHPSPLSSIYMTPLSADIQISLSNNTAQTICSPDHSSTTTPLSPSPPPPPPPKFVRSFKEVDTSSVLASSSTSPIHSASSSIFPLTRQSSIDTSLNGSFSLSSCTPNQYETPKLSDECQNDRLMTQEFKTPLHEPTSILSGSYPFVPPAIACYNSRDKSSLFEEKSMRLHRISQRLQANSAIFIKNLNAQNEDKLPDVPEKLVKIANHIEPESKTYPEKKAEEEEDSKRKLLDEKLKEYYLNNGEKIADYIVDQVQLVKLRNKAYRLFCCLFPEVQMPLRLSPDSEAVDQLLKTAVNMLEEKECRDVKQLDDMVVPPSEEKTLEVSCQSSSWQQTKTECQPQPRVILCCQPQKCLLQLQGLVRQFLCLVLPHLDAYLSSDASLTVMDKIVDRVVLANCAFIGLSSTNGQCHSAPAAEDHSSVGESRDPGNPEEPIR